MARLFAGTSRFSYPAWKPEFYPKNVPATEFRHESWLCDEVYERLAKRNIALCLAESDRLEVPKVFTADFGYFRLRKGDYGEDARRGIADQVRALLAGGRDVYVYFKHEDDP